MVVDDALESMTGMARLPPAELVARTLALLEQPPLFDLEVVSACNVVCVFCPREEMARSRARLDGPTFDAVLKFLPEKAVVMLSGLGDALLHPRISEMVARLGSRGVSACVVTNGVRLVPDLQDALIAAGVAEIQVSVHGLDEVVVRRVVPVGADPAATRRHVERLVEQNAARVRINFVETADNAAERPRVERWARDLGVRFFRRRQHTRGGTVGTARAGHAVAGCGIFGAVTFISSDGEILPCVNDVRGEGRLGSVRNTKWDDVVAWKRRVIRDSRWFTACRECDDDFRWVLLARGTVEGAESRR